MAIDGFGGKRIIGVLALQGGFAKHMAMLQSIGASPREIRKPEELDECDALIIPGGESTTILRQLNFIGLKDKIKEFSKMKPIFGTCAGLILMSKEIVGHEMDSLGLLDISVERNAFGRQLDSFESEILVTLPSSKEQRLPAVFIRAPIIRKSSQNVKILAQFDKEPILIQEGHHLGATFHPELTSNPTIHLYFLSLIKSF